MMVDLVGCIVSFDAAKVSACAVALRLPRGVPRREYIWGRMDCRPPAPFVTRSSQFVAWTA
jgi:hypothetical protein